MLYYHGILSIAMLMHHRLKKKKVDCERVRGLIEQTAAQREAQGMPRCRYALFSATYSDQVMCVCKGGLQEEIKRRLDVADLTCRVTYGTEPNNQTTTGDGQRPRFRPAHPQAPRHPAPQERGACSGISIDRLLRGVRRSHVVSPPLKTGYSTDQSLFIR